MKDKKSKITLTLDKEKIIKSKTMTDRFFPVSEMRMKKTQEVIKEDPIPLNLISSNNSENLKNKKKEKIHHILTKFQRSDINSKSSSAKKIDDLRYSDYLTRSKSKQIDLKSYNIKIKPLTSRLTQEVNSYRSNTQTKFFNNNHKETNTQFEDTVKNNSNLNRRRNEIKHTSVNPTQSAVVKMEKQNNLSSTRNNEIQRININLETENFVNEKENKYMNSKVKATKHKFTSSNTSEDLNISHNRNLILNNIHKNSSLDILELKNLEESSLKSDKKNSIKLPQKHMNYKMKSQNLHIMNSSSKAKDNINKFSSKKSLIDPSPSKVQFNLRSRSNKDKKRPGRLFSNLGDKHIVPELTESYTIERSIPKNAELFKKLSLNTEKKSPKKDIIKKIDKLDENKIVKLEKLLEKLDDFEITNSKKRKKMKVSKTKVPERVHSVNKFNINYIQTDNINFGNININLSSSNNLCTNKLLTKRSDEDKLRSSLNLNLETKRNKKEVRFSDKNSDDKLEHKLSLSKIRSNTFSPVSNSNVITISVLSNWGHHREVGLTEIQLFDSKLQKISILGSHIVNRNDDNVSKFHNNKIFTIDENDMWISNFNKNMKIELFFKENCEVHNIVIWNFNGKDPNKGVKEIEVISGRKVVWKGVVNKGSYSLKGDFSTHISLSLSDDEDKKSIAEMKNLKSSDYISLEKKSGKLELELEETNTIGRRSMNLEDSGNNNEVSSLNNYSLRVSRSCEANSSKKNESKSIKLILKSNWGDSESVGLSKIQFLDENNQIISKTNIECFSINTNKCSSLDYLFEYDNDEMWWATINPIIHSPDFCEFEDILIEIVFKKYTLLNGIIFWNYNEKGELNKGVKQISLLIDNKKLSQNNNIVLRKGIGELCNNYCQIIKFPLINYIYKEEELQPFKEYKPASVLYYQDFDTPYLPSGYIYKFSLISNWGDENFIGFKKIEFFDQNGHSVLRYLTPKILSFPVETDLNNPSDGFLASFISSKFIENEDKETNKVFFIFERPISLSYIQIWNYSEPSKIGVREIIITCDDNIIFNGCVKSCEGEDSSCCILFTSDKIITKEIHSKIYTESQTQKSFVQIENQLVKIIDFSLISSQLMKIFDLSLQQIFFVN